MIERAQPAVPPPAAPPPFAPTRGQQSRQRPRSAILTAGQHPFATRAMERVTVDEIVASADVARDAATDLL